MTAYQIGYVLGTLITPLLLMLFIGTIYYLIKGRRIPYQKAIFTRWVIISSLVIFLLGLVGRTSANIQNDSSHVYPKENVKVFTEACINSAKTNVDIKVAENLCSCSITEIQRLYTFGEFKKIDMEMQQGKSMPSGFTEALTICIKKK